MTIDYRSRDLALIEAGYLIITSKGLRLPINTSRIRNNRGLRPLLNSLRSELRVNNQHQPQPNTEWHAEPSAFQRPGLITPCYHLCNSIYQQVL